MIPDPDPLRVVRLDEARAAPWANGRGTTRELEHRRTAAGGTLLRLSVAEVTEAGPFSPFPGLDRVLVVIAGPGFTLDVEGRRLAVTPFQPLDFSGEAAAAVTAIAAPVCVFNAMAARGHAPLTVRVARSGFVAGGDDASLFVAEGRFRSGETTLGPGTLAQWLPRAGAPVWRGTGVALVVGGGPPP